MTTQSAVMEPGWLVRWVKRPWILAVAVVFCLVLGWLLFGQGEAEGISTEYYEVRQEDFLISIVEGGTLTAVNEIVIRNEVEGTARIIYIVPEGTFVKKGQLVVELDAAGAEDQVNQQEIAYQKAQFGLVQAQEQLAIQQSQADSDIRAAELKLELANIELKKFLKGDKDQKRRELDLEIETIKEKLAIDQDRLKWTEELVKQGFETKQTLDRDKLTVSSSLMSLEQATNKLWMWEEFDLEKSETEFRAKVEEYQKELERVRHQAKSKLSQYEAEMRTAESTLELNRRKLERDKANLLGTKIYAPADGLAIYRMGDSRFSSESIIEEGATVRNRQELIKLPDTSQMKLVIKVHESHVAMVKPGQPAYVVLDPMPDRRFSAMVTKVALLPDGSSRWGNPDLKVYNTEVLITDQLPDTVKPGVSARAEVVVTNLEDVIKVPVQAVTTLKGKPVVYLAGTPPKAVPVDIGMFNSKFIQITDGLSSGDRVLLSPPLDAEAADLGGGIIRSGEAVPTNGPAARLPNATDEPGGQAGPWNGGGGGEPVRPGGAGGAGGTGADGGRPRGERGGFNREDMLKRFDKNGDGELDDEERAAMREAFPRNRGNEGGGSGGPGGGRGGERDSGGSDRGGGRVGPSGGGGPSSQ